MNNDKPAPAEPQPDAQFEQWFATHYDKGRLTLRDAWQAAEQRATRAANRIKWEVSILHTELDKLKIPRDETGSDGGDMLTLWGRVFLALDYAKQHTEHAERCALEAAAKFVEENLASGHSKRIARDIRALSAPAQTPSEEER